jgi:hypothetical protein
VQTTFSYLILPLHSAISTTAIMKLVPLLALFFGAAAALSAHSPRDAPLRTPRKLVQRPKKFTGAHTARAAKMPDGAPTEFKIGLDKATRKLSKSSLTKLPSNYIDADSKRRRDSLMALRLLQRQSTANDFYQCSTDSVSLLGSSHALAISFFPPLSGPSVLS